MTATTTTYTAIIAAAGKSTRINGAGKTAKATKGQGAANLKQFATLGDKPVLWHAAQPFLRRADIGEVRVIVDGAAAAKLARAMFDDARVKVMDKGGETRAQTVINGIADLAAETMAIIHDAARPCLHDDSLAALLAEVGNDENGALLAMPVFDALKRTFRGKSQKTLSRNNRWRAQTPQVFRAGLLHAALKAHPHAMDDSAAMEKAGYAPAIVRGRADNIKITDGDDMRMAELILAAAMTKPSTTKPSTKKPAAKKPAKSAKAK